MEKAYTLFYTFCERYYAKINQVCQKQNLTKANKARNPRKLRNASYATMIKCFLSATANILPQHHGAECLCPSGGGKRTWQIILKLIPRRQAAKKSEIHHITEQ